MSAECISKVKDCLERLTDQMLKEKDPPCEPIYADISLIPHITGIRKGNFVIEAHTGAGKTTLGLILYHKARLKEIPEYDVIYINLRQTKEALRIADAEFEQKILSVIFNHESAEHKKAEGYIYSSTELKIECSNIYNCIDGYRGMWRGKRLIVVLDELERAIGWNVLARILTDWFTETRKFYENSGLIPVKLVVLMPKILRIKDFQQMLRENYEAVAVFTEFRTLSITESALRSYIENLAHHINQRLSRLLSHENFRLLIKVLSKLESGRYIFPKLWQAISTAVCSATGGTIEGSDLKSIVEGLKRPDINVQDVDIYSILDPTVVGIAEGKPFKTEGSRAEVIEMWENGFSNLCDEVRSNLPGIKGRETAGLKPLRIGYTDFVCKLDETYAWLTLEKGLFRNTIVTVGNKILESLRATGATSINIVALVPEFTRGIPIREYKLERESKVESKGRRTKTTASITMRFKYRSLSTEELLSIATMGGLIGFDMEIARNIMNELAQDITSMATAPW